VTRRFRFLCTWLAAVPIGTAVAQSAAPPAESPRTFSLRVDNDAFDFWMLPWNRPDEDYTSGVHLDYDGGGLPRWAHRLMPRRPTCAAGVAECGGSRLELGQDIYTAAVSESDPHAAATARPSAGWLYLEQTARELSADRSDELSLSIGVTGPPSLAQFTQRLAHRAAPTFNRPTDWSRQIGFEPGAIVRYERRRRVALISGALDLIPEASVSVGNVLTEATAGVHVRSGWHLPHPWLTERASTSIFADAGLSGQTIARTLFLDGNTFTSGPRVGHEPIVGTGEMGIGLRIHSFSLEYRAVNQTRAYAAGPKWHPWASIVGGLTIER
jgi:hypothetical protein